MRRVLTALLTAAALCCGSVVAAAPASATAPVTIKKIANVKVPYGKKATIRPQVTTHGSTAVSSQLLTVKAGKKTVAKNVTSAKLKAGTYTVTVVDGETVLATAVVAVRPGATAVADLPVTGGG